MRSSGATSTALRPVVRRVEQRWRGAPWQTIRRAMYGHTVISTPASVRVNDREDLRSGA